MVRLLRNNKNKVRSVPRDIRCVAAPTKHHSKHFNADSAAVIVGVQHVSSTFNMTFFNTYDADETDFPGLPGVTRDVENWQKILPQLGYPEENITVLLNTSATSEALQRELTRLVENYTQVLLVFSGHGITNPTESKSPLYLCMYDKTVSHTSIKGILQSHNTRAAFIIDCCHAGAVAHRHCDHQARQPNFMFHLTSSGDNVVPEDSHPPLHPLATSSSRCNKTFRFPFRNRRPKLVASQYTVQPAMPTNDDHFYTKNNMLSGLQIFAACSATSTTTDYSFGGRFTLQILNLLRNEEWMDKHLCTLDDIATELDRDALLVNLPHSDCGKLVFRYTADQVYQPNEAATSHRNHQPAKAGTDLTFIARRMQETAEELSTMQGQLIRDSIDANRSLIRLHNGTTHFHVNLRNYLESCTGGTLNMNLAWRNRTTVNNNSSTVGNGLLSPVGDTSSVGNISSVGPTSSVGDTSAVDNNLSTVGHNSLSVGNGCSVGNGLSVDSGLSTVGNGLSLQGETLRDIVEQLGGFPNANTQAEQLCELLRSATGRSPTPDTCGRVMQAYFKQYLDGRDDPRSSMAA